MAQRLAVLLACASILLISCSADSPSAEAAATQKYDKKQHNKHDKYEKQDAYKPDSYKPDSYKADSHKPDSYKPDSHKPEYKVEGYKPDGYKPGHRGEKPYGRYGGDSYHGGESYHGNHESDYNGYGSQYQDELESPYDGGYWGGMNGHHIIHLEAVFPERSINSSLINPGREMPAANKKCSEEDITQCQQDYGLFCGLRHHEAYESSGYGNDYAYGRGTIFKTNPTTPVAIAKGWGTLEFLDDEPFDGIKLVTFNKNQRGYKLGSINGFIKPADGAEECHPLLESTNKIEFNEKRVPIYLIFGKIQLPVDPAIVLPFGGFPYITDRKSSRAQLMGDSKSKDEYMATPEGNKYMVDGNKAYLVNEKDSSLCGLAVVAKGPVTITMPAETMGDDDVVFKGTIEWPLLWTDFITTLPLLISDDVEAPAPRQSLQQFLLGTGFELLKENFGRVLDRVAAVCQANDNVPWIAPASVTIDVTRVPTVNP